MSNQVFKFDKDILGAESTLGKYDAGILGLPSTKNNQKPNDLREVQIKVTAEIVGYCYLVADAVDTFEGGKYYITKYFKVDTFRMILTGTDENGGELKENFEVLRYGVIANKSNGMATSYYYQGFGKDWGQRDGDFLPKVFKYTDLYTRGYFEIIGPYYIHGGTSTPSSEPKSSTGRINKGCIAVLLNQYGGFKNKIRKWSGLSVNENVSEKIEKYELNQLISFDLLKVNIEPFEYTERNLLPNEILTLNTKISF